ncbi:receptor-like protein EIX2 [Ziziphus jujuba]|uniref:Receptor-like protein EIX2 n=1 Tax=Ziziphus jujuba TaxID=326968 RepID=A0A6P6FMV7_ZIZJJ|nr:receptor-like protein EIX2 [Ziziphus jujuba]
MTTRSSLLQIAAHSLLLAYLLGGVSGYISSAGVGGSKTKCTDAERQALLHFKDNLEDKNDILSSWSNDEYKNNCCLWDGIRCDNKTGHVVMLDLSHMDLSARGKYTSPPLIELRYLNYLNLNSNNLTMNHISSLIGNDVMVSLQHLDLSGSGIEGPIPETLGNNMTSLSHLDLSQNNLQGSIPKSLGNMSHLEHLDLRDNHLEGSIPEVFGNMATLAYLDLGQNNFSGSIPLTFENMTSTLTHLALDYNDLEGFIPNSFGQKLTSIAYLDLSKNKLQGSITHYFGNNMISLKFLALDNNELGGPIPESFGNFSALERLYLSFNILNGSVPITFGNMTALVYLGLRFNKLSSIPETIGDMISLENLDIGGNKVSGEIPNSIWNICSLQSLSAYSNNLSGQLPELTQSSSMCTNHSLRILLLSYNRIKGLFPNLSLFSDLESLDLSSNQLSGSVHPSIGQLSQLKFLDISNNSLQGVLSEAHFLKLSNVNFLDLTSNKLIFNVSSAWVAPFKLDTIYLTSCKLGPKFPNWLRTQDTYFMLDISKTGISDSVPNWFWNLSTGFQTMNVSNNQIRGKIADSIINWNSYPEIDLSSNQLEGGVPMFLFKATSLHLSRNKFSSINSMCGVTVDSRLSFLDVSHNQLSGELSNCWSHFKNLVVLNLANNFELSGKVPTSIGSLTHMQTLRLTNNKFIGEIPLSLKKCTELVVMDMGDNKLSGPIPSWIGKSLQNLVILILRSNDFNGSIPSTLCHVPYLQLLDLSANNISGKIPKCLKNFSAMRSSNATDNSTTIEHFYDSYNTSTTSGTSHYADQIQVMWKGILSDYGNTLRLVKSIDLSGNMLNGEIPAEITELVGLISFNLSRNNLSAQIPQHIGYLKSLDSLDLSYNHFSGQIPPTLALIDRLSVLDLSNNNLSGKIPTGTQLQSFNADAYMGNIGLCGAPLPKRCPGEEEPIAPSESTAEGDYKDGFISSGFYVSLGVGYVVGFWELCGMLVFNKSWRYVYFKFLNDFTDWFYVMAALHKPKFLRTHAISYQ